MANYINLWPILRKRYRYIKYISLLYILIGIVLLTLSFNQLHLAIITALFSISFYCALGYICDHYDCAMAERETKYWKSIVQMDTNGILLGRKWYSWLFYLLIVLLMVAGILVQMALFRPIKLTLFAFGSFLSGIGTFSWIYYSVIKKISSRMQSFE